MRSESFYIHSLVIAFCLDCATFLSDFSVVYGVWLVRRQNGVLGWCVSLTTVLTIFAGGEAFSVFSEIPLDKDDIPM